MSSLPSNRDGNYHNIILWLEWLIKKDSTTGGPLAINIPHYEIHEGDMYISDVEVVGGTLALCFKTPIGTQLHFVFQWAAESKAHFELVEGGTWSTSTGSQNPIYNRDRNSSNTSSVLEDTTGSFGTSMFLVKDPTAIGGGTIIHDEYSWSDKRETVRNRDTNEFILLEDTTYVCRLISDDGSKGLHESLHWYEE